MSVTVSVNCVDRATRVALNFAVTRLPGILKLGRMLQDAPRNIPLRVYTKGIVNHYNFHL